jgi:UDP:flavonoid glycosyltransferase YjiC (YdhE family)
MRPDIMVADFAPLAGLAARGRVPLVHTGNGYTLPPPEMMRFPPLHRRSPPVWNEELTLETVNAAAASTGLRRIERLPQLFYGEACLVQTFPLLDPYDTQRTADLDGPIFDQPPTARVTGSQSIFVYWSAGRVPHASILDALMPVAERLRIFAPQWSQSALQSLAARGAQVQPAPKPLSGILGTSSVVVHNGGSGVAAEALAAGVPQIVLSTHIEQRLTGEVLERAGLAKLIRIHQLTTTRLEQALTPDDEMTAKAAEIGVHCRDLLASKDALRNCEKICLGLIGQG